MGERGRLELALIYDDVAAAFARAVAAGCTPLAEPKCSRPQISWHFPAASTRDAASSAAPI